MRHLLGRLLMTAVVAGLIWLILPWHSMVVAVVFLIELWIGFTAGVAWANR